MEFTLVLFISFLLLFVAITWPDTSRLIYDLSKLKNQIKDGHALPYCKRGNEYIPAVSEPFWEIVGRLAILTVFAAFFAVVIGYNF